MSLILHIDTAVEGASIALAEEGRLIKAAESTDTRDSARWLQPAILLLMKTAGRTLHELDAIALSGGPGSYTGLRVGMASAKGLCYALSKPLICINTLRMMSAAALPATDGWLCPMIDARRMEVFTAVYNRQLEEIMGTRNMILEEKSFDELLTNKKISFFGNGSHKYRTLLSHPNANFLDISATAAHLVDEALNKFRQKSFTEIAWSEPFYGKDFYSPSIK